MSRTVLLATFVLAAALIVPAQAAAEYGWPVKPFDAQHPVRGGYGDPRQEPLEPASTFHQGIDIAAPDGTPVYATLSGHVFVERAQTVAIQSDDGQTVFSYWHIVPAVVTGELAVARQTVIGHIAPTWGHVHFAETQAGAQLNPLRPGALTPYLDWTSPAIGAISFERSGKTLQLARLRGTVDVVIQAYDTPPLVAPGLWGNTPLGPALVRWRILRGVAPAQPWRTALDFRLFLPPNEVLSGIYAPGTLQNRAGHPGLYRYFLVRRWDVGALGAGSYALEVQAQDTAGNFARSRLPFQVVS